MAGTHYEQNFAAELGVHKSACLLLEDVAPELLADEAYHVQAVPQLRPVVHVLLRELPPHPVACTDSAVRHLCSCAGSCVLLQAALTYSLDGCSWRDVRLPGIAVHQLDAQVLQAAFGDQAPLAERHPAAAL